MSEVGIMQNKANEGGEQLVGLISDEFIDWGLDTIAYIRELEDSTGKTYALSSADGKEMGIFECRDVAVAFAVQHDLEACRLNQSGSDFLASICFKSRISVFQIDRSAAFLFSDVVKD